MLLTVPVLLYQSLFVLAMYAASRIGSRAGVVAMALAPLWTATHVFRPPLMLLQALVIVGSWWWFLRARMDSPSRRTD